MYLFTLICFKFFLIKTIFEQISFRTFWIELCKSCKIKLYDIIAAISDTVYKKTVPVDVVFTTSTYNKIYNLPMSSGDWFDSSEINKTLCMVVNKAAQNYFDTSYAVGNVESSLSLTPFNVVGTVNDGTDIPTVYLDAHSIELLVPNMWKVKNATVHWHSEAGITMRQMSCREETDATGATVISSSMEKVTATK